MKRLNNDEKNIFIFLKIQKLTSYSLLTDEENTLNIKQEDQRAILTRKVYENASK